MLLLILVFLQDVLNNLGSCELDEDVETEDIDEEDYDYTEEIEEEWDDADDECYQRVVYESGIYHQLRL